MSPDKLFNYLEGKLSSSERAELEAALVSDPVLQRELAIARQIHSGMRGDSRELVVPDDAAAQRGRKMAFRVGMFFIVLMAINVGAGLWIIAHKRANPNRPLLEKQTRDQITKSLEQAAASALATTPSLGVIELAVPVAAGKLNSVADDIVATATRLGGSATKGIPDDHQVSVLADLPANRESEFRAAIATMTGGTPPSPSPATSATAETDKQSFVIRIVEATPK